MQKIKFITAVMGFMALASISLAEEATESLSVGKGKAKLGALLQAWMVDDTTTLSTAGDSNLNYRLRRAEIKLSGSVTEQTRWLVMIDPAKTLKNGSVTSSNDNRILQDLLVGFNVTPEVELVAGQFKIPTMSEGLDSPSEIFFPERAYISRYWGDSRQPGMMVNATFGPLQARIMGSNGQPSPGANATNIDDTNNSKDLSARLDYKVFEGLKLGAWYNQSNAIAGISNRYGANFRWDWEDLTLKAEGAQAKEFDIDRNGLYADLAYKIGQFMPAFRYENFQVTTDPVQSSASAYTLGLNYLLAGNNAKIQLAGSLLKNMSSSTTTSTTGVNVSSGTYVPAAGRDGTLVILNAQMAL
jgi:hypothetical protein